MTRYFGSGSEALFLHIGFRIALALQSDLETTNVVEHHYATCQKSLRNVALHGAELPGCLDRRVFRDYADKPSAMKAIAEEENGCPLCGKPMEYGPWKSQQGKRYMAAASCPEHGARFVRIRFAEDESGLKVIRLIYEGDSEAAKALEKAPEKARVHRRRCRKKTIQA